MLAYVKIEEVVSGLPSGLQVRDSDFRLAFSKAYTRF